MAACTFEAIGTQWHIELFGVRDARQKDCEQKIKSRIDTFDATYSRFRSDSLISHLAANVGTYVFPSDSVELFALYRKMYDLSDGKVTPLIGQLLSDAGYDASYSLKTSRLRPLLKWDDVMDWDASQRTLTVRQPVLLDFGAAGKGYLVDIIGDLLRANGVSEFCIDAGGDMLVSMKIPQRIGLEDPRDETLVIGTCDVTEGALCGSADNRRSWHGFTHIMDPVTLKPADSLSAVWVGASSAAEADALTTMLYFASPEVLKTEFKFEYVMLNRGGLARVSRGWAGELFAEIA